MSKQEQSSVELSLMCALARVLHELCLLRLKHQNYEASPYSERVDSEAHRCVKPSPLKETHNPTKNRVCVLRTVVMRSTRCTAFSNLGLRRPPPLQMRQRER